MRRPDKKAPAPLQAILYARVSSREQAEGYSIEAQLKLLREYAHKKGLPVAREFVDVETAKKEGRPAFGEMLRFFKGPGAVKTLLVEKTDRLYRNFRDYVTLEECAVEVHLVKEGGLISPQSCSHEKFIHGIKVLMAKNYCDNLSEEVKKGMHEKASKGLYPCRAPIGYKNNKETRGIDLDPVKAPFVRKMFEWYATGQMSLEAICKRAYDEGFIYQTSHPKVAKSSLERILKNAIYIGRFEFMGKTYRGNHEPLVSDQLFNAVQAVFQGHNKPKYRKHDFAFGGILTCADCGCTITAEVKKGRYIYYHCTQRRGACAQAKAIREESLVNEVAAVVHGITLDKSLVEALRSHILVTLEEAAKLRGQTKATLKEQLETLKERLDKAYEDRLDGKLSEALWIRKSKEWETEIFRLESLVGMTEIADETFQSEGLIVLELLEAASLLYETQDQAGKRDFLNLVCSNLYLKDGKVTAEYRKPFDSMALMKAGEYPSSQETPAFAGVSARWSGRQDSNLRLSAPKADALPD